jgi:class 3 adenylate cyclase
LEIRWVVAQATRLFRPATRRTAGAVIQAIGDGLFAIWLAAVPVGGSPAPPIFKTGS